MLRLLLITLLFTLSLDARLHEAKMDHFTFEAAQKYCRDLGEGEWRVPHISELFTLRGNRDFSKGRSFWSSVTTLDENTKQGTGSEGEGGYQELLGYAFFLQDGDVTITPASKQIGVICTDEPFKAVRSAYTITKDGIRDTDNGILWQALDATDKKAKYSFEEAKEFCESLAMNDRSWRLPSLDELYSIVTYERLRPSLNTAIFGNMMHRYYWSDDEFNEAEAYVVGFKLGSVATSSKKNRSYLRCVSDLDE